MGRLKNNLEDVWKKINKKENDDCWEWVGALSNNGYGAFVLNQKTYSSHRIVYELIYGSISSGYCILHKCNNPSCCNPSHLYLGTHADNSKQMVNEGRSCRGEKNGRSKLNVEQIREIRRLYSTGKYYQRELGIRFGVSRSEIGRIVNGIMWGYIC